MRVDLSLQSLQLRVASEDVGLQNSRLGRARSFQGDEHIKKTHVHQVKEHATNHQNGRVRVITGIQPLKRRSTGKRARVQAPDLDPSEAENERSKEVRGKNTRDARR